VDKKQTAGFRNMLAEYANRVGSFRANAWLYLGSSLVAGATIGVFRLLFNFYVLSLGYDEDLLGNFISTSNMVALFSALPLGYLIDKWGRKNALLTRVLLLSGTVAAMALWPSVWLFFLMNAVWGIAMAMNSVVVGPFLMENSDEEQRTYLFSLSSGLQMFAMFLGNWVGGNIPSWIGAYQDISATSSSAYAGAMLIIAVIGLLALIPIALITPAKASTTGERNEFEPLKFVREHPGLMVKFFTPLLLVSIGAGLFVPFMNVYFRVVHHQPDPVIGSVMAWGSMAMAVGFLFAPPLAERLGKLRLVVLTQSLSIPFMIILGFVPMFGIAAGAYYVRMALMNMSNPIYQNFVLEQSDRESRATVASLYSMVWNFGRAFSPSVSGSLQVSYGFGPPFAIAIALYAAAISLYYVFFIRGKATAAIDAAAAD
jgi:MFS family permease